MKIFFFLCILTASFNAQWACFRPARLTKVTNEGIATVPAFTVNLPQSTYLREGFGNQPGHAATGLHSKGKGTFAFVTGAVLGPVGLAFVHMFSHNPVSRQKALQGFGVWMLVVLLGLATWGIATSKESFGQLAGDILGSITEGIVEGIANGIGSSD